MQAVHLQNLLPQQQIWLPPRYPDPYKRTTNKMALFRYYRFLRVSIRSPIHPIFFGNVPVSSGCIQPYYTPSFSQLSIKGENCGCSVYA